MRSFHQHVTLFEYLANELNDLLEGFYFQDAFSINSEEITLVFFKGKESLSIRLNIEARTGLLFFQEHAPDRSGGAFPLFQSLIGQLVIKVLPHFGNRSFEIEVESGQILVFKLYGPLSNVILFEEGKVRQLFRPQIENDKHLTLESFRATHAMVEEGKDFTGKYYIYQSGGKENPEFALLFSPTEKGECIWEGDNVFEALSVFARIYLKTYRFVSRKKALLNDLSQKIKRQEQILNSSRIRLNHLNTEVPPDEIGHILMANLHQIHKGDTEVTLQDFYRDQLISIKLKKDKNPQENAAYYYSKARNRKYEFGEIEKRILEAESKLVQLRQDYEKAMKSADLKDLKATDEGKGNRNRQIQPEKFRYAEFSGYKIYVGKSSENNDELTLKFAHKDDIWLHAKGVSGSHVIIKHHQGQNVPMPVIEKAAKAAAWFSKAKTSGLVPVIYTYKKFVRKPKGAHAGQVAVEREEIIMVEPGNIFS